MDRHRILAVASWAIAACVLLFLAWSLIARPREPELFVDPNAERPRTQWDGLLGPARPWPGVDTAALDGLKLEVLEGEVKFESPAMAYFGSRSLYGYDVRDLRGASSAGATSGSLDLRFVGFAAVDRLSTVTKAHGNAYGRASIDLWTPEGISASQEEMVRIFPNAWERTPSLRAGRHELRLVFDLHGLENPRLLGVWVFDRRTKASLVDSAVWSHRDENPRTVGCRLGTWRSAPVDVIVDVAHGPFETRECAPDVGERVVVGGVECRLVHIADSGVNRSGSRLMGTAGYFGFDSSDPGEAVTHFVFNMSPPTKMPMLEISGVGADGRVFGPKGRNVVSSLVGIGVGATRNDVASLRLQVRPYTTRFVFSLDRLPGLPEVNSEVDDLLDVRVPYAFAADQWDLRDLLSELLQLRAVQLPGSVSASPFPREYEDVTARELLEDLLAFYPLAEIEIDEAAGFLRLKAPRKTWPRRVADRLARLWGRIFP